LKHIKHRPVTLGLLVGLVGPACVDLSGLAPPAPLEPSLPLGEPAPPPPTSRALRCDGDDDGLRVHLAGALDGAQALTIELWFRVDDPGEVGQPQIPLLAAINRDSGRQDLAVRLVDGYAREHRTVQFYSSKLEPGSQGGGRGVGWGPALELGRWYHLAATIERRAEDGRSSTRLYVDGERARGGSTWPADESFAYAVDELRLCHGKPAHGPFGLPFAGAIDELRVSEGVRYRSGFTPALFETDAQTLLLLRLDELPPRDDSGHSFAVDVVGDPQLIERTPVG